MNRRNNQSTVSPRRVREKISAVDWAFEDSNTKSLTHDIHRYSGKYIPQVAGHAIDIVSAPGDLILDPYVGSGTTLLEANLLKRRSLGIDLNPLAVLIAKVKTTPIDEQDLKDLYRHFSEALSQSESSRNGQEALFRSTGQLKNIGHDSADDPRLQDAWYVKWFAKPILADLIYIDHLISRYPREDCANVARISLSNILRKCSNAHSGYPNVMFDSKKINRSQPNALFLTELRKNFEKISDLADCFDGKIETRVVHGDATNLPLPSNAIDAIVTHPPYIGSVPYAEYGLLSLTWLGHNSKELDSELTGGKRQTKDVVDRFRSGYEKMLRESHRVLKLGKYIFILVGDPTVKGRVIDLADLTMKLAHEVGFELIAEKERKGINRRANKMGPETVLVFRKS